MIAISAPTSSSIIALVCSGPGVKRRKDEPIGKPRGGKQEPAAPTGWLARKLAELQKKAQDVQRDAERRRGRDRA